MYLIFLLINGFFCNLNNNLKILSLSKKIFLKYFDKYRMNIYVFWCDLMMLLMYLCKFFIEVKIILL